MSNLYDTLLEKMQGKEYVGYFSAWCPFEEHKARALLVNESGYKCMSCHKRGSLNYLYTIVTGGTYAPQNRAENDKVLPMFKKWLEMYGSIPEIAESSHKFLTSNRSYQKYLRERKLDKFIELGMFGYKEGWITIPVRDEQGQIVDIICRGISKEKTRYVLLRQDKTSRLYCPDWERVQQSEFIYIPYGIFDSWALYDAGLATVTGTTGTSLSAELIKPLRKQYVIIPDKDEESKAYHLANNLGWRADVKRIEYPDYKKDLDEIRRQFGSEYLSHLLGTQEIYYGMA